MPRLLATLVLCCSFLGVRTLPGQILSDFGPSSNSTPSLPLERQSTSLPRLQGTSDFMLGSPHPLLALPKIDDPTKDAGAPSPLQWSDSYGPLRGATNFGVPTPGAQKFRIQPGMTREEIVRRKAELEMQKRLDWEERLSRIRTEVETRQGVQKGLMGLQGLFNESANHVPHKLENDHSFGRSLPNQAAVGIDSPSTGLGRPADNPSPSRSPEQAPSEQARWNHELLERREEAQRRRQERRTEAERGADMFVISPVLALSPQRLREGWCHLFDGQTFFGWQTQQDGPYGGGQFAIHDDGPQGGEIRSDPRHPGLLYTTDQFGDSTVLFEYQAEKNAEAYLLLRATPNPRDLRSSCYAIVLNSTDASQPVGSVLGRQHPSADQLRTKEKGDESFDTQRNLPGGTNWCRVVARFEGTHLQVTIDRNPAVTLLDTAPPGYGHIGLLVKRGDVRFRNLYWKPASAMPLFDPVAPEKFWKFDKDVVRVKPTRQGTMQLTGGPGVIESPDTYDNFVLQFEYNIAYNSARSGLFFHSVPGIEPSGYEISIQNFPTRADRDAVVGVDAGSFRSVRNGRYVRPQDQTWNFVTLSAVDRRFRTWVNGVPVAEMNVAGLSSGMPQVNPAVVGPTTAGSFLPPGTIRILAPTPDTNVDFRNFRITAILPRLQAK